MNVDFSGTAFPLKSNLLLSNNLMPKTFKQMTANKVVTQL